MSSRLHPNQSRSNQNLKPRRPPVRPPPRTTNKPKYQTIPKLPTHPLQNLGLKKQNKLGGNQKSIFLAPKKLAFQSALPELKLDPISYFVSNEANESVLSQFSNYQTSYLEIDYKHTIETERDLGISLDLNQYLLNNVFKETISKDKHILDPEDENLINADIGSDQLSFQRKELLNTQETWLRRSKYIDVRDHQTARQVSTSYARQESPQVVVKTQSDLKEEVQNTFNVSIPKVHPSKPDVTCEVVFDFVPNIDLWGIDYARVAFDTNPLPSYIFDGKDETEKQHMLFVLGNNLYRGGVIDRNLCREELTLAEETDYLLPLDDKYYVKEKRYDLDSEVEYNFVRTYSVKSILNEELLAKQKFIAASGRRQLSNGLFLMLDSDSQKASYCKISNEIQVRKKATEKTDINLSYVEEKPQVFIRGRDLTNAEKEEIESRKSVLELDMDLF